MTLDVGTIGKRASEVNLNKILMEIGDEPISSFVVSTLVKFRMGMRQLDHVPDDAWRHVFTTQFHAEYVEKIMTKKLPAVVESHALCCLKTYYRDFHENIRNDVAPEPGA